MAKNVDYDVPLDYKDEFLWSPQYIYNYEQPISASTVTLSATTGSTITFRIGGNG